MCQNCQQVIEKLAINIELFFNDLNTLANKKKLSDLDRVIICHSLLGFSRQEIANIVKLFDQKIRDRLTNNIYPRIAELMCVDQEEIAGNWVKIINFLLNPQKGYKLNPAPQLNSDNFQGSFGRQIFLYPPNQEIVKVQIEGTHFYQQGLYYQAFQCFVMAWNKERKIYGIGNPEVLIYINNCLIEYKKSLLEKEGIKIYTLSIAQSFCQIGAQLWGTENLTWRSATAFDSVLIILKILEEYQSQVSQCLLTHMNQYFKEKRKHVKGVTGLIQFERSGDRLNPPAEIVAVKWDEEQQKWKWKI